MSTDRLPEPPWLEKRVVHRVRKPMASPLTRTAIVDAAIELVDAEGLEALTVRRLADRLDVTMMALYWHVRDKAQLLDLVGEEVLAGIELPATTGEWTADLAALAGAARDGLRRHPNAAELAFGRPRYGPSGLALFERLLQVLESAGFDPEQAGLAYMAVYTFLRGNWASESAGGADAASLADYRDYLAGLPAERFPHVRATGPGLFRRSPDDFFVTGLQVVIAGLADALPKTAPSKP